MIQRIKREQDPTDLAPWRHRVASYRLRRSSAKLGKLARRRKQRENSIVGLLDLIALGHVVRTKRLADTSESWWPKSARSDTT